MALTEILSAAVWERLRCVECGRPLRPAEDGAVCSVCGRRYPRTGYGSLDLRLTKTKAYPLEFTLAPTPPTEHSFVSVPLEKNPAPQVDLPAFRFPGT